MQCGTKRASSSQSQWEENFTARTPVLTPPTRALQCLPWITEVEKNWPTWVAASWRKCGLNYRIPSCSEFAGRTYWSSALRISAAKSGLCAHKKGLPWTNNVFFFLRRSRATHGSTFSLFWNGTGNSLLIPKNTRLQYFPCGSVNIHNRYKQRSISLKKFWNLGFVEGLQYTSLLLSFSFWKVPCGFLDFGDIPFPSPLMPNYFM